MSKSFFILILASCSCFASTDYTHYESPFSTRYASPEMSELFSLQKRHAAWRSVCVALAEAEKE
jgi:adenylosuccinate lyase